MYLHNTSKAQILYYVWKNPLEGSMVSSHITMEGGWGETTRTLVPWRQEFSLLGI